ncbi:MAG: response regulator [Nitrospiraceae bacterium]|nr:response regulator [Nitrospiraceae bacterium]
MIPNKKTKILVVNDEESIRALLQKVLAGQQRTIVLAEEGRKAIEMFRRERPDVTILDLRMPDVSGLNVLKEIRAMNPSATVIIYSGMAGGTAEQQARALGVSDFIEKGCSLRPLGQALNPPV